MTESEIIKAIKALAKVAKAFPAPSSLREIAADKIKELIKLIQP